MNNKRHSDPSRDEAWKYLDYVPGKPIENKTQRLNRVGARAMGWKDKEDTNGWYFKADDYWTNYTKDNWSPYTDLKHAMMVLREMSKKGWAYLIEETPSISSFLNGVRVILVKGVIPVSSIINFAEIDKNLKASAIAGKPEQAIMLAVEKILEDK